MFVPVQTELPAISFSEIFFLGNITLKHDFSCPATIIVPKENVISGLHKIMYAWVFILTCTFCR